MLPLCVCAFDMLLPLPSFRVLIQVHDESAPLEQFYGEGFEATTFPADPPPAGLDGYDDNSEGVGGHNGY
jgi:hypothetical protein